MTPVLVIQSALKEKLKDGRNTVLLLHVYYFTEVFCQLNSAVEKVLIFFGNGRCDIYTSSPIKVYPKSSKLHINFS